VPPAGLSEIEATEQLADEEDVDALGNLRPQRRVFGERRICGRRAEVREAAKLLANLQQTGFGALIWRQGVELVVSHCAEQNGIGVKAYVDGRLGKRSAFGSDGDAADQRVGECEIMAAELGDGLKDLGGFARDFGADAVSGEDCNLQ